MRISISELEHDEKVLSGNGRGALLMASLIREVGELAGPGSTGGEPEPLFLDFAGIDVATSSYLRAGVIGFRDYCRTAGLRFYPVVANAVRDVLDDFAIVLEQLGDGFLICDLDKREKPVNARVLGRLEGKQQITLDAVISLGETDAARLAEAFKDERIGVTGWNNRLAALVARGLLMETRKGRGKVYRPVLELG